MILTRRAEHCAIGSLPLLLLQARPRGDNRHLLSTMSDSAQKTQSDSKPFATGTVDFELQQENERLRSRIATLENENTELKKVLNKGDIAASVRRPAAKSKHFTVDFKDAEFAKKERRNSVINGVDIGTRGGEFVVQSTTEHVSSDAAVVPIATKEEDSQEVSQIYSSNSAVFADHS